MTIEQGRANIKTTGYNRTRNKIYMKRSSRHWTQTQLVNILGQIQTRNTFFLTTYYHTLSTGRGKTFILSYYISFYTFSQKKFRFAWFRAALIRPEKLSSYFLANRCSNPQKCWKNSIAEMESFQSDKRFTALKVIQT